MKERREKTQVEAETESKIYSSNPSVVCKNGNRKRGREI